MRKTLEAIGYPIRNYTFEITRDCTIAQINSDAPDDLLEGASEAIVRFDSEVKPDDLSVKIIVASEIDSGRVIASGMVWYMGWKHGGNSTPPQIVETSLDTRTNPKAKL